MIHAASRWISRLRVSIKHAAIDRPPHSCIYRLAVIDIPREKVRDQTSSLSFPLAPRGKDVRMEKAESCKGTRQIRYGE